MHSTNIKMDIKKFLTDSGLEEAIPIFEMHKITIPQLSEMNRDDFKELLPALGDRLKLRKALKQGRGVKEGKVTRRRKTNDGHLTSIKTMIKNDPEKRAFIVEMLKNERHVADLYQMASKVLIDFSLFSFDEGCRPISSDWKLIDFATGKLNCLLCEEKIQLQTRNDCATLWNVGNYKRHFVKEHINGKSDYLETEETKQISSFLEVVLTEGSEIDMEEDVSMELMDDVQQGQQQIDGQKFDIVQDVDKSSDNSVDILRDRTVSMAMETTVTTLLTDAAAASESFEPSSVNTGNFTTNDVGTECVVENERGIQLSNKNESSDVVLSSGQENVVALGVHQTGYTFDGNTVMITENTHIYTGLSNQTAITDRHLVKGDPTNASEVEMKLPEKEVSIEVIDDVQHGQQPIDEQKFDIVQDADKSSDNSVDILRDRTVSMAMETTVTTLLTDAAAASESFEPSSVNTGNFTTNDVGTECVVENERGIQLSNKNESSDVVLSSGQENVVALGDHQTGCTFDGNTVMITENTQIYTGLPNQTTITDPIDVFVKGDPTNASEVEMKLPEKEVSIELIDDVQHGQQPIDEQKFDIVPDAVPDWKKTDTKYGWVKYSPREAWKPGFLYPDGLAQYVTKSGQLSDVKRPFHVFETTIPETSKRTFKQGLNKFNNRNHCNFE